MHEKTNRAKADCKKLCSLINQNPLEPFEAPRTPEHRQATSQIRLDLFLAPLPELSSTSITTFTFSLSRGLDILPQSTEPAPGYDCNTPSQHVQGGMECRRTPRARSFKRNFW